jgi:hypothetical protein
MTRPEGCGPPASGVRDQEHLLLVAPPPRFVQEAVSTGYAVWTVIDRRDGAAGRDPAAGTARGPGARPLQADFGDVPALCDLIAETAREHRIGRLLAFGDVSTLPALLETAERLGLSPNPAGSARLLGDPSQMRRLLNTNRHGYVASACAQSSGELSAAVGKMGMPALVRPLGPGAARPRAVLVRDPGDIDAGFVRERLSGHPGPYLVETFLEGPEYGVATLTVDGMHRVLGITALHHGGQEGYSHLFPAPLTARVEAEIRAAAAGLLDFAGYEFGFAYTVAVLTADGPRIVRSQARQADEPVDRLIELATGFAPEAELLRALSGTPVEPPVAHGCASAVSFRTEPGREPPVSRLKEIAGLPGVRDIRLPPPPADAPVPAADGGRNGQGHVVLTAGCPAEAARRVAAVLRLLGAAAG